jgi:hypothetical protein
LCIEAGRILTDPLLKTTPELPAERFHYWSSVSLRPVPAVTGIQEFLLLKPAGEVRWNRGEPFCFSSLPIIWRGQKATRLFFVVILIRIAIKNGSSKHPSGGIL